IRTSPILSSRTQSILRRSVQAVMSPPPGPANASTAAVAAHAVARPYAFGMMEAVIKARQARGCARSKAHVARVHVVGHVGQQGTVLVQKDRRCQGHDVSFMGRTITSGTTI